MELQNLINMGKTNQYYASLTVDLFKRIYSNKPFRILIRTSVIGDIFDTLEPLEYSGDEVIVSDMQLFENLLKTYGHNIKKVHIEYMKPRNVDRGSARPSQSNEVQKWLERYCSESLIELIISNFTSNPLSGITNIFSNVKTVLFDGVSATINGLNFNKGLKLNEIFPAVRRMSLIIQNGQYPYFCVEFHHLEHVAIEYRYSVSQVQRAVDTMNMNNFFLKNPQITNLHFSYASLSYVKKLTNMLPNLHTLALVLVPHNFNFNDDICFGKVRKFSIIADELPVNIIFDQLEEVEFGVRGAVSMQ